MARVTSESTPERPARAPRAPRTLVQKLAPVVLGFESIVVFLAGLTIFGLKSLPAGIDQWWAIVGGAVVGLACIVIAGMITKPWAITAGWVIQIIVALSAILVPAILLVVLIFGGMWGYATIMGARVDAQNASAASEPLPQTPTDSDRE